VKSLDVMRFSGPEPPTPPEKKNVSPLWTNS